LKGTSPVFAEHLIEGPVDFKKIEKFHTGSMEEEEDHMDQKEAKEQLTPLWEHLQSFIEGLIERYDKYQGDLNDSLEVKGQTE